MFGFTRLTVLIVMVVVSGIFAGISAGLAQTTSPAESDSPAQQRIRSALEGNATATETGDLVLDDILGVIKQRGSVLDGSSLDPATESIPPESDQSKRAFAAELLLKSSRTLEQIGPADKTRQELVAKMRGEAHRLLSP